MIRSLLSKEARRSQWNQDEFLHYFHSRHYGSSQRANKKSAAELAMLPSGSHRRSPLFDFIIHIEGKNSVVQVRTNRSIIALSVENELQRLPASPHPIISLSSLLDSASFNPYSRRRRQVGQGDAVDPSPEQSSHTNQARIMPDA